MVIQFGVNYICMTIKMLDNTTPVETKIPSAKEKGKIIKSMGTPSNKNEKGNCSKESWILTLSLRNPMT